MITLRQQANEPIAIRKPSQYKPVDRLLDISLSNLQLFFIVNNKPVYINMLGWLIDHFQFQMKYSGEVKKGNS